MTPPRRKRCQEPFSKKVPDTFFLVLVIAACGADSDEFRVKREADFEFAQKPTVMRRGDRFEIHFEAKSLCDATVAIEESASQDPPPTTHHPRIVRHLASGVLGPNAPEPFQKNSRAQTIAWDGKNDKGAYLDDLSRLTVRVSLGLRAEYERSLGWSPERRVSDMPPAMVAAPEGVYVFEGCGLDHLRLFDHDGRYIRTLVPFAGDKLPKINGLQWFGFPQGDRLPLKVGSYQQTFLTSGDNAAKNGMGGTAATALAVRDGRIALVHERLNRLSTDGTTGGRPLLGPVEVTFPFRTLGINADGRPRRVAPTSAAFSPDGKWVYLAGYAWRITWHFDLLHGVIRIPYEEDGPSTLFAGNMEQNAFGADNAHFNGAASVACDRAGRVYVADLGNDRIQVFDPSGTYLKTIPTYKPAQVEVHPRTQEIYVFSWPVYSRAIREHVIKPSLTRYGPLEDPKKIASYPLPWPEYNGRHNEWWDRPPLAFRAALDGSTNPPTVWLAGGHLGGQTLPWNEFNTRVLREKDGRLEVIRDFGQAVVRATGRAKFPCFNYQMQRLTVNPRTGRVFLAEPDSGPANKAYKQLVEFDPETGKPRLVDLPFNCEDLCFDQDGLVYLRTTDVVVRYDPETWVEKPWDYGQELPSVTCGMYGRSAPAVAGLVMPSVPPVCFHQGGMAVSPKGHLAVSCAYRTESEGRVEKETLPAYGKAYQPQLYPGRLMSSTGACLHVWDERGRPIYQDAVKGMPQLDGLGIDQDDRLYVMATPTRILDGQPYFNRLSGTLMRLDPAKARFISNSPRADIPLPKGAEPKRPPQITGAQFGAGWVEGADWMYGGVGLAAFNQSQCACWHSRFTLDYFARSFAPEMDRFCVAVLDKNGNLILRIGQYGNEDEQGLFYGAFLATHTDRRLFIADAGNARLLSLKLDYYTTASVPLSEAAQGQ
jgi:hypothetical protein